MRLDRAGQSTRRVVLRKDMDDSLVDEKNVVEIDLYKSTFDLRVKGWEAFAWNGTSYQVINTSANISFCMSFEDLL